jgi:alpha-L-rhamnosidase
VQVDTDRGESRWSPPATFETGLLRAADWTACWIRPAEADPPPAAKRPAYELRGVIIMAKPVVRARLYATAHGIYEAFLGGRRIGDLELTPGFTQYPKRLQVQAYDVTALVAEGATEFTALLSDGWFRGQVGITRAHDQWGGRTAFLRPAVPFLAGPLPAGMIDRVTSAGRGGDVFEPRHTTHGFRYIRVEGHPGDLTAGDVTGVVVHTDMRRTGCRGGSVGRRDHRQHLACRARRGDREPGQVPPWLGGLG